MYSCCHIYISQVFCFKLKASIPRVLAFFILVFFFYKVEVRSEPFKGRLVKRIFMVRVSN